MNILDKVRGKDDEGKNKVWRETPSNKYQVI